MLFVRFSIKPRRVLILWFLVLWFLIATTGVVHSAEKRIGILVFDKVLTSDVTAPLEVFGAATKKAWFSSYTVITIATTEKKTIRTEEGLTIIADKTIFDDIKLDVLIVPSAYEMDAHIKNKKIIGFINKHQQSNAWMASNCSGAFLLGEAGVLDGKKATTWFGGEKDLKKAYPKIDVQFDQNVVVDGNIITSNGGPVSYEAAFTLLEKLSSKKYAAEIMEAIQYDRLKVKG